MFTLFSFLEVRKVIFFALGNSSFCPPFPHFFQILGTRAVLSLLWQVCILLAGWYFLFSFFFFPLILFKRGGGGIKICVWGTCNNVVMFLVV